MFSTAFISSEKEITRKLEADCLAAFNYGTESNMHDRKENFKQLMKFLDEQKSKTWKGRITRKKSRKKFG